MSPCHQSLLKYSKEPAADRHCISCRNTGLLTNTIDIAVTAWMVASTTRGLRGNISSCRSSMIGFNSSVSRCCSSTHTLSSSAARYRRRLLHRLRSLSLTRPGSSASLSVRTTLSFGHDLAQSRSRYSCSSSVVSRHFTLLLGKVVSCQLVSARLCSQII